MINFEEITEDQLYKIIRQTCELKLDVEWYKVEGYTEDMVWLSSAAREYDYSSSFAGLLEDIKKSDMPVEFFQLKKFASIEKVRKNNVTNGG